MAEETQPIDNRPTWLVANQAEGTTPGILEIDGTTYRYTIVKPGLAPGLPYAVGFPSEQALFISEDVPTEDRPFIMTHEVREKTRFAKLPEEERCQASLSAELDDVMRVAPERYADYVSQRRSFFNALVTFYEQPQQASAVTPQFKQGLTSARNYIQTIQAIPPGTFSAPR